MVKKVWTFPGQGSQEVGMGRGLWDASKEVRDLFKKAEDVTNRPIREIAFEGPKEVLDRTSNTQVAMIVVSLGILAVYLKKHRGQPDSQPDFVAGHSVGEFAAAVVAGSMTPEDAIALINERGLAMEQAGEENPGRMAAILGLTDDEVERIAMNNGAYVANYNIPDVQTIISGEAGAVESSLDDASEAGAKKVVPLDVSIAAHSPLMFGAIEHVRDKINGIHILDPIIPVVANRTGQLVTKAAELYEMLPEQLVLPVRWGKGVEFMRRQGAVEFIEFGSGHILQRMVRRHLGRGDVTSRHAEDELLGR
jgi:[acyl-carrier-protein] S-malonyltransferase